MKPYLLILGLCLLSMSAAASCECETLSGTLQSNKTLLSTECYTLSECYRVETGYTLTIQPGTVIYGQSSSSLLIEPGAVLIAQGTEERPIVFTSSQSTGNRTPGFWSGIVIAGQAPNNQPDDEITYESDCSLTGGGQNAHDYSGILRFVQIHYARNGLTLLGVGDGTTIREVQVSHALENGIQFMGGDVNAQYLATYNAGKNDYFMTMGYQGKLQFLLGFRQDLLSWHSDLSHGLRLENDPSGSQQSPITHPIVSNMTLLGPAYCHSSGIPAAFKHAISVDRAAGASLYNSVLGSWPQYGLYLEDTVIIGYTSQDLFNATNLSFDANGLGDYEKQGLHWTGGCGPDMTAWMNQYPWASCSEQGNQFSPIATLGYDATSLCGSSSQRDFSLGSHSLSAPGFLGITPLSDPFFDSSPSFRGAFGSTDWTDYWTDWNPQQAAYCEASLSRSSDARTLTLIPNPSNGKLMARFHAPELGIARIRVADKVNGQLWYQSHRILMAGPQEIPLQLDGIPEGLYLVQLKLNKYFFYQVLQIK